jgi:cytochrome c2
VVADRSPVQEQRARDGRDLTFVCSQAHDRVQSETRGQGDGLRDVVDRATGQTSRPKMVGPPWRRDRLRTWTSTGRPGRG